MSRPWNRKITLDLKAARNAVNAGRASWKFARPDPETRPMTDGEREIVQEQERDARECEESMREVESRRTDDRDDDEPGVRLADDGEPMAMSDMIPW